MKKDELISLVRSVFDLPDIIQVEITESENGCHDILHVQHGHPHDHLLHGGEGGALTLIEFRIDGKRNISFAVPKGIAFMEREDLEVARKDLEGSLKKYNPIVARLYRLGGWWMIFAGSLALFSVCPVCGQAGCPVGIGVFGVLSGLLAFLKVFMKDMTGFLFRRRNRS